MSQRHARRSRAATKTTAAVGILVMLFGALLVVAPGASAAGNGFRAECRAILGVSADTVVYGAKWQWSGPSSPEVAQSESLNGLTALLGWTPFDGADDDLDADDGTHFTFSGASKLVYKAGVKQADDPLFIQSFTPPAIAGEFDFTNLRGDNVFSHVTLCGYTPDTRSLTVTKQIASQDPDLLDDEFSVTIAGENGTSGMLTDDEDLDVLDASGNYTISEIVPTGWQTPTLDCGAVTATPVQGGGWTVTVGSTSVACTLTNTPETRAGTGGLVVSKVAGTNAPGTSPTFTFTVNCDVSGDAIDPDSTTAGMTETFDLTFGNSKSFSGLHEDATCEVVETVVGGASSTSVSVNNGAGAPGTSAPDVAITPDQNATVAFTNNFTRVNTTCEQRGDCPITTTTPPPTAPPEAASLTIVKAVTGDVPDEWSADFEGTESLGTFTLSGTDAVITDEITFDDLEAGDYSVVETDSGLAALTGIVCEEGADPILDLDNGSLSVALDEGDDVTCTFTNGFPEVAGEVVTPPVEPAPAPAPAPVAEPAEKVLGQTVTRTLPRTGSSTGHLVTAGIALMIFGGILVGGSRRFLQVG